MQSGLVHNLIVYTLLSDENEQREILPLADEFTASRFKVIQLLDTDQEPWRGGWMEN